METKGRETKMRKSTEEKDLTKRPSVQESAPYLWSRVGALLKTGLAAQ